MNSFQESWPAGDVRLLDRRTEGVALRDDGEDEDADGPVPGLDGVRVPDLLVALVHGEHAADGEQHDRDEEGVDVALAAVAEGVFGGVAARLAFLPPSSSRPWLPESASEWTPSASIDDEPLNRNATNLAAAMARLALSAATMALVPPDALMEVPSSLRRSPCGGRSGPWPDLAAAHCRASGDDGGAEHRARTGQFGRFARGYEDGGAAESGSAVRRPRGLARRAQAGSAGSAPSGGGGGAGGQDVTGEPELVDRGRVQLLAVGGGLGAQHAGVGRLEAYDPQQFGDVDVLGGQAAAQDVVGVGHDLHAQAARGKRAGRPRRGTAPRRAGVGRG